MPDGLVPTLAAQRPRPPPHGRHGTAGSAARLLAGRGEGYHLAPRMTWLRPPPPPRRCQPQHAPPAVDRVEGPAESRRGLLWGQPQQHLVLSVGPRRTAVGPRPGRRVGNLQGLPLRPNRFDPPPRPPRNVGVREPVQQRRRPPLRPRPPSLGLTSRQRLLGHPRVAGPCHGTFKCAPPRRDGGGGPRRSGRSEVDG